MAAITAHAQRNLRKMEDSRVCAPPLAESDAQNNTSRTQYGSSVTDADKVINTNIDSTKFEGVRRDEDLLKDLLADDYCHVCEAVLLFESQRLSHYEGKKHAQRVRVFLQTKKAGKRKRAAAWAQWRPDEDHVCRLCNMVFSSHMVATSHYEGKVHAKNMRKQGLQSQDRRPGTWPVGEPVSTSAQDLPLDQQVSASSPNAEEDPRDPNRRCSLCAATFNNPRMALQHYNGRKHQRNLSRRELLKGLEDQLRQADCLMCQICDVQLNSVEMFQAHMQGNKHLSRQKKVADLCKSQQKVYGTFADELSDYIQIQKARGITPRLPALPPKDGQQEEKSRGGDGVGGGEDADVGPLIGCDSPAGRGPPPGLGPLRPSRSLALMRQKRRKPSSSSSSSSSSASSSSYLSSDSSGTGASEDSGRRSERRRRERTKTEEGREGWNRGKLGDSEERRRKTRRGQGRPRGQDRRHRAEDAEPAPEEGVTDAPSRHRNRRESKKMKDSRTEEERLWDDSILGF